jgi:serine/threonine protein phosphatase PrpC
MGRSSEICCAAVESWGVTRQGRACRENQDAFLNWPENLLWGVADGVGGGVNGAEASRLLVRNLMHAPCPASLEAHVAGVSRILHQSHRQLHGLAAGRAASTIVVLMIHETRAACLWAGDSRCYLLRQNVLYLCSRDHTVRQRKIERNELTAHEAVRMVPGNVLTSVVGCDGDLRLGSVGFPLRRGDRFLLCSDGLTEMLPPETLAASLREPQAMAAAMRLAKSLDARGHRDDATVVTVFLTGGR